MIDKNKPIEQGEIEGLKYYILLCPCSDAGYNGYIEFPRRPVRETGYQGIISYVPVHGGITYAQEEKNGVMTYGFDTAHCDSHEFPIHDKEWIKGQIKIMADAIKLAAKVEAKYLKCLTNKGRAKYAQMVQDVNPNRGFNMGVAINLLSGQL